MRKHGRTLSVVTALIALMVSIQALAKSDKPEPVGHLVPSSTLIQFLPSIDNERIHLTIVAPDGTTMAAQFPNGKVPTVRLQDLFGGRPSDGAYLYELRV